MAMLRGSYRYQVLKFESKQRRRQNEEMKESSVDDILQSTQHLSMSKQTLGLDTDSHKVRSAMKLKKGLESFNGIFQLH